METAHKTSWPPEYSLRISQKAKRVYLKIIPNKGLEIIVPTRQLNKIIISDLLAEKRSWIEKHLSSLKIIVPELITELNLQAIQQTWQIIYQPTDSKQLRHKTQDYNLILSGDVNNINKVNSWLQTWLKKLAHAQLLPWLENLSIKHALPYNKAAIRNQQTLWGSCTAQKNISLNYKLLFLPTGYAEHVMLHELCHTRHLNHSQHFWNLLYKLDPQTGLHDRGIRVSNKYVPIGLVE